MKSFNLFSFNLSPHVVSRNFQFSFHLLLVWSVEKWKERRKKKNWNSMYDGMLIHENFHPFFLFLQIFFLLHFVALHSVRRNCKARKRLFNLFLQAKQFSTNQQNHKNSMDLTLTCEDYKYNYFSTHSFTSPYKRQPIAFHRHTII